MPFVIIRNTSECFKDEEESERVRNYCDIGIECSENKEPVTSMYEEEFTAMLHLYHCQVRNQCWNHIELIYWK